MWILIDRAGPSWLFARQGESRAAAPHEEDVVPRVSVVIPAYNGVSTIEKTVDSVRGQSLADIEIVLVDDASTDGTSTILQQLAAEDGRIKVVHQERDLKTAQARRAGIEAATGEYLMFVDAGDELHPGACEAILGKMLADPVDILHFGVEVRLVGSTQGDPREFEKFFDPYPVRLEGSAVFEGCFVRRLYGWNVCNKMFRTEVCKRAAADIVALDAMRAEDASVYAAISLCASSYRGWAGSRFSVCNFGDGMDGRSPVDLDQFERLCRSRLSADAIIDLLRRKGIYERYRTGLAKFESELAEGCARQLLTRLPEELRPEGYRIFLRQWGAELALPALARFCWDRQGEFVQGMAGSEALQVRVGHVRRIGTYYHKFHGGGAENVLRALVGIWLSMGYEVTLFLDEAVGEDVELPHGVDAVILDPPFDQVAPENLADRVRSLTEGATSHHIDVMVYHGWLNVSLLWDILALKSVGVATVVHCHGIFSHFLQFEGDPVTREPLVFSLADAIISLSEVDARFWGYYNGNVFETINPPTFDVRTVSPAALDGKTILWLSRISPEKRPFDALETLKIVRESIPDARMVMVGDAAWEGFRRAFKERADSYDFGDALTLTGWDDDTLPFYEQASVFLMLCDPQEGYPLTLTEAKAVGLPCVTYDHEYLTVIRRRRGIVTVPYRDVAAAAAAVVVLLDDRDLRHRMGADARADAEGLAGFDFEGLWREVFDSLGRPHPAPGTRDVNRARWDSAIRANGIGRERLRDSLDAAVAERDERIRSLEREVADKDSQLDTLSEDVDAIVSSVSFRSGRFVTWLPRKVRDLSRGDMPS